MAAFVAILLLSNVLGAGKVADGRPAGHRRRGRSAPASCSSRSPIVIGDVLTEVYGYARARRCIWAGFAALLFMAFMSWVVVALAARGQLARAGGLRGGIRPGAADRVRVDRRLLGRRVRQQRRAGEDEDLDPRAGICGRGRSARRWLAQGVDSLIFYPLAFWGVWDSDTLLVVLLTQWALKVGWEALLTPVTYAVVGFLKRREGIDVYDSGTDFSPFKTQV